MENINQANLLSQHFSSVYAGEEVGNADYHSAIATYLGLSINYLKGYVGKQFKSARGTTSKIDEHGEKHWKRIGAYNSREARGTFMTRFVRKIGITAAVQLSILRRKAFNRMMGADLRAQAEAGEEAGEEDNNGNRYYSAQQEYQSNYCSNSPLYREQ